MKKIIVLAALLLSFISSFAQDGKSLYRKYSDEPNISAVYVSPAMFRLIGRIPDIQAADGDVNLTPVIQALTGLYIISSENPDINAKLSKDVKKFINSGTYELLMEAKEDGEKMTMYTCGDEKTVTSFVMLADEGSEVTFICLDGKLDRNKLEEMMSSQAK
ncbi:MAG: DUF4252 domain-containing protein [Bacteroidales bacterium]|nr:DUF4252 domain-containing protein [Bacteroidales bacterium]